MSKIRHSRQPQGQPPQTWGARPPSSPPSQPSRWPEPQQASPPGQPPYQWQPAPPPRKRRRIFFWIFLAVQILFLIWVIAGAASGSGTPESCSGLTGDSLQLCKDASDIGTTIGVGLVIAFWVATDFILALTYVIYRMASRQPRT
ncbi:hypothetical protein [Streptomyces sp. NBC_00038]|uniref:hypothetical protein n=1 Tax=Streptomyces sp. NBC_00038 TaxID=2903615 RepID=UPI00225121B7|nr:hypothetical protein [Streptomyces sp. NBC_00038]MCX5559301.1 hypothetical protein [Streptomyces sp. NBC_00038]